MNGDMTLWVNKELQHHPYSMYPVNCLGSINTKLLVISATLQSKDNPFCIIVEQMQAF